MKVETRKVVILEDVDKDKINELIRMLSGKYDEDEDARNVIVCTLEYLEFLSKSFD